LAQGTRLGYAITGYLNKETSSDTDINPILEEEEMILQDQTLLMSQRKIKIR